MARSESGQQSLLFCLRRIRLSHGRARGERRSRLSQRKSLSKLPWSLRRSCWIPLRKCVGIKVTARRAPKIADCGRRTPTGSQRGTAHQNIKLRSPLARSATAPARTGLATEYRTFRIGTFARRSAHPKHILQNPPMSQTTILWAWRRFSRFARRIARHSRSSRRSTDGPSRSALPERPRE